MRRAILAVAVPACLAVVVCPRHADAAVLRIPVTERAVITNPSVLGERRILMKFELPRLLSDAEVEIAMLEFRTPVDAAGCSGGVAVDCFAVTAPWSEETASWNDGWSSAGGDFDGARHAAWAAAPEDSSLIQFDVTSTAADWASGTAGNNGVVISVSPASGGALATGSGVAAVAHEATLVVWYAPHRDE